MTTVVKSEPVKIKSAFIIPEKFEKSIERGSVVLDKINTEASIYSIHLKNKFNHFVYSIKSSLPMPINSHIIEIENGIVKLFICNEYENNRDISVDFIAF